MDKKWVKNLRNVLLLGIVCIIMFVTGFVVGKNVDDKREMVEQSVMSDRSEEAQISITEENSGNNEHEWVASNEVQEEEDNQELEEETMYSEKNVGPFGEHGKLEVQGTQLVDQDNNPYALIGISTHGIAEFSQFVTKETFLTLRDEWNANVIRLAMYTAEAKGYCVVPEDKREDTYALMCKGIDAATELGLYVIADWHILYDNDPAMHQELAIDFFQRLSEKYKEQDNIIYEICNEPNGKVSWQDVKRYAEAVIPVIRANDPDAIILVGTPTWSQDVDIAAADPLSQFENIMYALHFYADTHRDGLRDKMETAIAQGLPILVSEYGICDASGNGYINYEESAKWVSFMNEKGVSYVMWNLSNKDESSAMIAPSVTSISNWSEEELSESGRWAVQMMNNRLAQYIPSEQSNPQSGSMIAPNFEFTSDMITVTAEKTNSWEGEQKQYTQYKFAVKNKEVYTISDWNMTVHFDQDIEVDQIWNATAELRGEYLVITPQIYNATIAAGETMDTIGVIVVSSSESNILGVE